MDRAWNYWAGVSPEGNKQVLRIILRLEAVLARFSPANADAYELEPGVTIGMLLARLGIPADEVMLVFVNDKMASLETEIPDRATVTLCPYICGE